MAGTNPTLTAAKRALRLAWVFLFFAVLTPGLHHIGEGFVRVSSTPAVAPATLVAAGTVATASSIAASDSDAQNACALCEWLLQATYAPAACVAAALVLLVRCAPRMWHARFAALCAHPAPHRGLRGPPVPHTV